MFPLAALQDASRATTGTATNLVRVVSGVLALVMVVVIIFRRKGGREPEKEEDDL
jgi:hypothetical protein